MHYFIIGNRRLGLLNKLCCKEQSHHKRPWDNARFLKTRAVIGWKVILLLRVRQIINYHLPCWSILSSYLSQITNNSPEIHLLISSSSIIFITSKDKFWKIDAIFYITQIETCSQSKHKAAVITIYGLGFSRNRISPTDVSLEMHTRCLERSSKPHKIKDTPRKQMS